LINGSGSLAADYKSYSPTASASLPTVSIP